MSKKVPTPPPGFDDLPVDEQIDFVQSLWDRIAATSTEELGSGMSIDLLM